MALRGTVVIVQHATNPLAAANTPLAIRSPERLNQLVTDALMIPLSMVVGDELGNRASKMSLPQRNYARKALLLDRPNEPLRVGVAVGCSERRLNDPNSPFCPTLEPDLLGGRPVVVAEKPAHSLAAANGAGRSLHKRTIDQLVRESLMIALARIVRGEFVQRLSEVPLTERHDTVQAFLFHRPDEPLGVRVAIRRCGRRPHDPNASGGQPLLNTSAPLRVPIADQSPSLAQSPVSPVVCRRH